MPTVPDIHRRGTRAAQATIAAPPLTVGTLYFVTDEGVTERWTGAAWESYSAVGGGTTPLPALHHTTHQVGGTDAIALDTLAAPTDVATLNASASAHGLLRKLSGVTTDVLKGDGTWGAVTGGTPGAHAPTHQSGGSDAIALDTLAAPTDITTLNASTTAHGLLRKLSGTGTQYLDGSGAWTTPPAGTPSAHHVSHETGGTDAIAALAASVITTGTIASARLPARIGAVGIVIDGGGSAITTGVKGFVEVPFACTITAVTLLSTDAAVTSGSIVVDIWKDTYANYAPTVADTITASAKPTLSSAIKSRDATLTGWTTAISAGDILGFKVDSVSTVTRVALSLTVQAS